MDMFSAIRFMILIIVITIAWFIGRMLVLPAVDKIFPNLPPVPVIKGIYTVVLEGTKAIFHYILIFLLIMYVIYCIIRKFVPEMIIFIPLRQPLLDLTPLYELRVSGIFPLMDRLTDVVLSSMPFSQRLYGVFTGVGEFLMKSIGFISDELSPLKQAIVGTAQQSAGNTGSLVRVEKPSSTVEKRSNALKKKRAPNSEDPMLNNEGGAEPGYKANYSKEGNIFVEKEFQQCIEQQYAEITPDMGMFQKLKANINNNKVAITCNVEKLKHYSNIKARE